MKPSEIHDACVAAGLPVVSIRETSKGVFSPVLSKEDEHRQAEADALVANMLARPKKDALVVLGALDALVVLQFDPSNESALAVLKARFNELSK